MSYKRGDFVVYRDKKGDPYVGQLQTNMTTQAMVVPWYSEQRFLVKLPSVVGVANDAGIRFYLEQKIHHAFKQAEYYATLAGTLQGELDNLSSRRGDASSSTDAPAPLTSPSDPLN